MRSDFRDCSGLVMLLSRATDKLSTDRRIDTYAVDAQNRFWDCPPPQRWLRDHRPYPPVNRMTAPAPETLRSARYVAYDSVRGGRMSVVALAFNEGVVYQES